MVIRQEEGLKFREGLAFYYSLMNKLDQVSNKLVYDVLNNSNKIVCGSDNLEDDKQLQARLARSFGDHLKSIVEEQKDLFEQEYHHIVNTWKTGLQYGADKEASDADYKELIRHVNSYNSLKDQNTKHMLVRFSKGAAELDGRAYSFINTDVYLDAMNEILTEDFGCLIKKEIPEELKRLDILVKNYPVKSLDGEVVVPFKCDKLIMEKQ